MKKKIELVIEGDFSDEKIKEFKESLDRLLENAQKDTIETPKDRIVIDEFYLVDPSYIVVEEDDGYAAVNRDHWDTDNIRVGLGWRFEWADVHESYILLDHEGNTYGLFGRDSDIVESFSKEVD